MNLADLQQMREVLVGMRDDRRVQEEALLANEWFLPGLQVAAIDAILQWFDGPELEKIVRAYMRNRHPKRIGLVLAGNVPLVGFHDVLMGLISGNHLMVKPSGKDRVLLETWLRRLPARISSQVSLLDELDAGKLDFLVATGSNTTAVQLRDQYQEVPQLIRKNRFSLAVLDGNEAPEQLNALATDCLMYHGMGCRSVSNVLVPQVWQAAPFLEALDRFPSDLLAQSWFENRRYQNAALKMSKVPIQRSKHVLLLESDTVSAPLFGTLNIVRYEDHEALARLTSDLDEQLQCQVGLGGLPLGSAQCPGLGDFADGVDLLAILGQL